MRPPILIAGGSERNTRRLVARDAGACDLVTSSLEDVAPKLDVLLTHCQAETHDYDTSARPRSIQGRLDDLCAFVVDAKRYAALGTRQLDVVPDRDPVEYTERLAGIVPRLAEF